MRLRRFPIEYQMDSQDCGPACLKMIAKYYGKYYSLQYLRDRCSISKDGVSIKELSFGAESIGLKTVGVRCSIEDLVHRMPLPAVAFWEQNHFVVVYGVRAKCVWVADPMKGRVKYTQEEWANGWLEADQSRGVLVGLQPTSDFHLTEGVHNHDRDTLLSMLSYLRPYSRSLMLVLGVMLVVTILQGLLPFISKAVIDVGIKTSDIRFINMVLIGNVVILMSVTSFNVLRDWLLMHITARVNIALISDYLIKLMRLPVSFFENKLLGDILQRAHDHERIRGFIMNHSLALIFSSLTFLVFAGILLWYNTKLFLVFAVGSALYVLWVLAFLRLRRKLDWRYFDLISKDQSYWVETVEAMQDIKIHNMEHSRRWRWEEIQASLYRVNQRTLAIGNAQSLGAEFIDNLKSMAITFLCATAVIRGEITFGVMISTQFIIGMLNGPVMQFINFVVSAQYAKISYLRMSEIKELKDEEELLSVGSSSIVPEGGELQLSNIHFQYNQGSPFVLKNIDLVIPEHKVTAIVGGSGSGKSTLLKLLVRLYAPSYGDITLGGMNVAAINLHLWREQIGVVMQDGKLFNDTICNNIVAGAERIDYNKLRACCRIAQIEDEINAMPKGFDTKIGEQGRGLSGGQRQRLLIARALYRNPKYLFLDEATNALDTKNESKIVAAPQGAFKQRTVVVIAHRLSTIRNADQIVVLDCGRIVERGTHDQLMRLGGHYASLIGAQE